jgi:hypothetical protein
MTDALTKPYHQICVEQSPDLRLNGVCGSKPSAHSMDGLSPPSAGRFFVRMVLSLDAAADLEFGSNARQNCWMKILTDDPDWKRDVYEARALAVAFVGKYGHAAEGGRQAIRNGLTVTFQTDQSPVQLTIDATGNRVLSVEWKPGDAWRVEIETYHPGRWQSRLKAAVRPRPWLARWRSFLTFTGTLPKQRSEKNPVPKP